MSNRDAGGEKTRAPLEKTVKTLAEPFLGFISAQSASGWLLLLVTVFALGISNSNWSAWYFDLLHIEFGVRFGTASLEMTLQHWVNDFLMALFFFLLGLELKRELLVGQLSDLRNATSVLCAALGGMLVPAGVFLTLAGTDAAARGWAIPLATDTAFALMILVLLGNRIPAAARAFLVGLAIVDDLGAILVIAFAYTSEFNTALLIPAAACVMTLVGLNLTGVRAGLPYLLAGCALWWYLTQLGLHGTLTGVVVALTAPVRPALARPAFIKRLKRSVRRFESEHDTDTSGILEQPEQQEIAQEVLRIAEQASPPLNRWEVHLEKPVSFVVMPVFAFMNAGITLSGDAIETAWTTDLSIGILAGLLVGKPLGILAGVWTGRLLGLADIPSSLSWRHVLGLGLLGGIGFTMSLFIATLSFGEGSMLLGVAKQSIIASSLCTGLLGYAWLRWACPANQ